MLRAEHLAGSNHLSGRGVDVEIFFLCIGVSSSGVAEIRNAVVPDAVFSHLERGTDIVLVVVPLRDVFGLHAVVHIGIEELLHIRQIIVDVFFLQGGSHLSGGEGFVGFSECCFLNGRIDFQ